MGFRVIEFRAIGFRVTGLGFLGLGLRLQSGFRVYLGPHRVC